MSQRIIDEVMRQILEERDKDEHGHGSNPHGGPKKKQSVGQLLKQYVGGHGVNNTAPGRVLANAENAVRSGEPEKDPIVAGIRKETVEGDAYRGQYVGKNDPVTTWMPGQEVQIMPSSFSKDASQANFFAQGGGPSNPQLEYEASLGDKFGRVPEEERGVEITLQISGGYNGIDVNNHIAAERDEKEVITGGRFRVESVHHEIVDGVATTRIGIKQVGVF